MVSEVSSHRGVRDVMIEAQRRALAESAAGSEEALLAAPQTDRLEVRRVQCRDRLDLALDGRYSILIVLDGEGAIEADSNEPYLLTAPV